MIHHPIVIGVTGASGAVYARRLLEVLLAAGHRVQLVMSRAGAQVWSHELGVPLPLDELAPQTLRLDLPPGDLERLEWYANDDFFAPPASGAAPSSGMVVVPCSGDTLSAVAHGAAGNLIRRAAEVHLKERRPLILVPRDTPLSLVAIRNMERAVEAGAVMLPAAPGWYHGVKSLDDLVDFIVARILTQLGLPQRLIPAWGTQPPITPSP